MYISTNTAFRNCAVLERYKNEFSQYKGSCHNPQLMAWSKRIYLVTARPGIIGTICRLWFVLLKKIRILSDDQIKVRQITFESNKVIYFAKIAALPDRFPIKANSYQQYISKIDAFEGEIVDPPKDKITSAYSCKDLTTPHPKGSVTVHDTTTHLPQLLVVDLYRTFPLFINGSCVYKPSPSEDFNTTTLAHLHSIPLFKSLLPYFNNNPKLALSVLKLTTQVMLADIAGFMHQKLLHIDYIIKKSEIARKIAIDYDKTSHQVVVKHHFTYKIESGSNKLQRPQHTRYLCIAVEMKMDAQELIMGDFSSFQGKETYSPFYKKLSEINNN